MEFGNPYTMATSAVPDQYCSNLTFGLTVSQVSMSVHYRVIQFTTSQACFCSPMACFSCCLVEYVNENGGGPLDMTNPIYQNPLPSSSTDPVVAPDEAEAEYLNCFKLELSQPEYLNVVQPIFNKSQSCGQKFGAQTSLDNPDYQEGFSAFGRSRANGHLPAKENVEYLGLTVEAQVH